MIQQTHCKLNVQVGCVALFQKMLRRAPNVWARSCRLHYAEFQIVTTEITNQQWLETYKSLVTLSIEGFKFSALANGGATVALLAYLGNVAGKGASVPDMRCPVAAFLTGLVFCGFAMLCSYLTQLKLLNEIGRTDKVVVSHAWLLWVAISLFAFSIVSFGVGSWQAVIRFR